MSDDKNPIYEDGPALAKSWLRENLEAMTPFQRYLHDNGLFDDVIRPLLDENDVILEPGDHCQPLGCEFCIG